MEALHVEVLGKTIDRSMVELAQTARPHQLTSYEAVYFDLAIPLLTDDSNLQTAAKRVGVELIEPA